MRSSDLLDILEVFPPEYGRVRDQHRAQLVPKEAGIVRWEYPDRFVLIFQDNPENWSVRWSIGKALQHFRWIKVVGQDGAWGAIDTSLTYAIPDAKIQEDTAFYFLKRLMIHPAEYAQTLRGDKSIHLFGVENQDLYERAQKLIGNQPEFLRLQVDRAEVIEKNLITEMEKRGENFAALTCCGDLPDLVSENLEFHHISYAVVRPRMSYPSDKGQYRDLLGGMVPGLDEIVSEPDDKLPEPLEDFPDKQMEEMKELARVRLIEEIRSGMLLRELEPVLPPEEFNQVSSVVRSNSHGPKTKAVLVKAELMSYLMPLARQVNRPRELGIGVLGVLAVMLGALFDWGTSVAWFPTVTVILFGLAVLNAVLVRRFMSALRWLLVIIGFLAGLNLYGRWGMLMGMVIALLIGTVLVGREKAAIRGRAREINTVQEILIGGA